MNDAGAVSHESFHIYCTVPSSQEEPNIWTKNVNLDNKNASKKKIFFPMMTFY